jgi:polyisoprenoid-binding protein YceI
MSTTQSSTINGTWQLDPVHSSVAFEVSYLAGTFKGTFREVGGELKVTDGRATLEGWAKVASIDVKDENLSTHLQTPDFFDAEQHPELRFRADGIDLSSQQVTVRGEIVIKGVTQPLEATGTVSGPLTDGFGNERIGLNLSTKVDRTAFGVSWNMPLPTGEQALSNEVKIIADLQFVKAS